MNGAAWAFIFGVLAVVLWLFFGHKVPTGPVVSTYDRPRWKKWVWMAVLAYLVVTFLMAGDSWK